MSIISVDYGSIGGSLEYLGYQTASVTNSSGSVTFSKTPKIVCGNLTDYSNTNIFLWDDVNGNLDSTFSVTVSGTTVQLRSDYATSHTAKVHAWG